jgi:hypothetical protein
LDLDGEQPLAQVVLQAKRALWETISMVIRRAREIIAASSDSGAPMVCASMMRGRRLAMAAQIRHRGPDDEGRGWTVEAGIAGLPTAGDHRPDVDRPPADDLGERTVRGRV